MVSNSPPPPVRIAMLLLFQLHLVCSAATSREVVLTVDDLHHSPESETQYSGQHSCTVDELLPDYALEDDLSSNWDQDQLVPPPFNCTCSTLKARWGKRRRWGRGGYTRVVHEGCGIFWRDRLVGRDDKVRPLGACNAEGFSLVWRCVFISLVELLCLCVVIIPFSRSYLINHHPTLCPSRRSYVCPKLGNEGYPMWVPTTVSKGSCKPLPTSALEEEPFPPNFKVLFYGNSHLRQVRLWRFVHFLFTATASEVYYNIVSIDISPLRRHVRSGNDTCMMGLEGYWKHTHGVTS